MKLSGSRMGLTKHCLYWARDDILWPEDSPGDAAIIGSWYHGCCAWLINVSINGMAGPSEPPKEPACLPDSSELTPLEDAKALLSELQGYDVRAEVAYAYSPRGVRLIGIDIGRDYGNLAHDEIPMSLDIVAINGSRAVVIDWKTGNPRNVDPASQNRQLATGAAAVFGYHGVTEVEVQLRYTDGSVDRHVYDEFDAVELELQLNRTISAIASNPKPNPGLHCTSKWCPIRATCPATERAAEVVGVEDAQSIVQAVSGVIETAEQAGTLYHRAQAARVLLDQVDTSIKAYVDQHGPIPVGDGLVFAAVEETRESIGGSSIDEVYTPLSGILSPEAFAECVKVSVPKTSLESAVKAASSGPKGKAWDAAMEALRGAGLVHAKTIVRHRVRKA